MNLTDVITAKAAAFGWESVFMPLYRLVSFPVLMLYAHVHQKVRLCLSGRNQGAKVCLRVDFRDDSKDWKREGNCGSAEVPGGLVRRR